MTNPILFLQNTASRYTIAAILVMGISVPAEASAHLPVPSESFLNYHAATVNELSQEVTLDPQVRARLANHFHLSPAQMQSYIRQNLVLRHLNRSGVYRVACLRPDGSEYWIESHLPAGTPIFASRATGQPILKLACGNPMVSMLPKTEIRKPLSPPQVASTPTLAPAGTQTAELTTTAVGGSQQVALVMDDALAPPVVEVSPSIQLLGGGSHLSSVFPILLGTGAAVSVFGHAGSGSNASPGTPEVPEASTFFSFGLLLLGSGLLLMKRRKSAVQPAA